MSSAATRLRSVPVTPTRPWTPSRRRWNRPSGPPDKQVGWYHPCYSSGPCSVAGDLATVDVQDLAGDERRRLEEHDRVDDVADLSDVPHRGEPCAEPGVARRGMGRGLDDSRRHGVDADAAGGVLHREGSGRRGQAALGE